MRALGLILLTALMLLGCGGTQALVKVKDISQAGPKPEWIENNYQIGTFDGKKVIFFYGTGQAKRKDTAQSTAELNAYGEAALAIAAVAQRQINDVCRKIDKNSGVIALTARNVKVSGMIKTGGWWELQGILSEQPDKKGVYEERFTYYSRFAMDYDLYVSRRNEYVQELSLSQKEKSEFILRLSELDKQ